MAAASRQACSARSLGRITGEFTAVSIAESDAHPVVGHAERGEHFLHEFETSLHLRGYLLLGAEEMRVILSEAAHAGHAIQLSRLLPSVDGSELRQPHRQIAVAVRLGGENFDVMRAVHRLQHEAIQQTCGIHYAFG